jgi:hypothetical protein
MTKRIARQIGDGQRKQCSTHSQIDLMKSTNMPPGGLGSNEPQAPTLFSYNTQPMHRQQRQQQQQPGATTYSCMPCALSTPTGYTGCLQRIPERVCTQGLQGSMFPHPLTYQAVLKDTASQSWAPGSSKQPSQTKAAVSNAHAQTTGGVAVAVLHS